MKRSFFVWILPGLWAVCSLLHYRVPGDEYGMYLYSSVAGSWIVLLLNLFSIQLEIQSLLFPVAIAITGAAVMAWVGFLMDRLNVRKIPWGLLFFLFTAMVFFALVMSFPSLEKALYKHGSWWAYIFSSLLVGLYLSAFFSLLLLRKKSSKMDFEKSPLPRIAKGQQAG